MQNESSGSQVIRFSTFELDVRAGELRKRGVKIGLQEQPLRILEMLLAHPGQFVTREELRSRLWPSNLCGFRSRPEQGDQQAARSAGRFRGQSAIRRNHATRGYRFLSDLKRYPGTLDPGGPAAG